VQTFAGPSAWDDLERWAVDRARRFRDFEIVGTRFDAWAAGSRVIPGLVPPNGYTVTQLGVALPEAGSLVFDRHALGQLAALTHLELALIERASVRSSEAFTALLAEEWQLQAGASSWLVRTDAGVLRAILSSHYTRVDTLPLLRSVRPVMASAGLLPIRVLHTPSQVRVEFAQRAPGTRAEYAPGVVLLNSEVADSRVVVAPALVRRAGIATRLESVDIVSYRHAGAVTEKVVVAVTERIPRMLDTACTAIEIWRRIRSVPTTGASDSTLLASLAACVGSSIACTVLLDWRGRSEAEQTYSRLYQDVAAQVRTWHPLDQTATDSLLHTLLDDSHARARSHDLLDNRRAPVVAVAPASARRAGGSASAPR
jgi:hypothetical protein